MLGEDELCRDVPGKHGLPGSVLGGDDLPETVLDEASLELCFKKTSLELDLVINTFLDLYLMKKTALNLTKMTSLVLCLVKMTSLQLYLARLTSLELCLEEKVLYRSGDEDDLSEETQRKIASRE